MNLTNVYSNETKKEVRAAIYCRLSKDDDLEGESASIGNQRDLLFRYCDEQGFRVCGVYQDDGFSGLSMERPDLKKLLEDAKKGNFDVVLTKDLSRLSRNYLHTGHLIEEYFPRCNVRYIAINDAIDSNTDNDIAPFRYVLGELYSKDVSKKVHSAYVTKAKSGKFTGCLAPFGYKKSPTDKNQLIIDEETAWIIKKIYEYARNGYGPNYIRRKLEDEEIPCPAWWNRQKGLRNKYTKFEREDPKRGRFIWDFTTIKEILENPVYIGSISSQKSQYKFKTGWLRDKKPEEWIIVEDCHEPIIDKAVFDIVKEKVQHRKRPDAWGNYSIFAGLLKCGQCGKAMNIRKANQKGEVRIYTCSKYNKYGVAHCSQHRMRYETLYNIVLDQIRSYAKQALADEDDVISKLQENCNAEQENERDIIMRSIAEDTERITALERIISRLYEDMVTEKISEDNFNALLSKSQTEQSTLKNRVTLNTKRINEKRQEIEDNSHWLNLIKEYSDIEELDALTLNRLIKKIVIHEDMDGDIIRQTVEIHFNFKDNADKYKLIRE
ncbi:MAG: recombinase family protein [Lachnospiraceae bacterium]